MPGVLAAGDCPVDFREFQARAAVFAVAVAFRHCAGGQAFRNEISPRSFVFAPRVFADGARVFRASNACRSARTAGRGAKAVFYGGNRRRSRVWKCLSQRRWQREWWARACAYWLAELLFVVVVPRAAQGLRLRQRGWLSHYSSKRGMWITSTRGASKSCLGCEPFRLCLKQQALHSGQELSVFVEAERRKVVPFVISLPWASSGLCSRCCWTRSKSNKAGRK